MPLLEDTFRKNSVLTDIVKKSSQIDLMLESGPKPRLMPGLAKLDQDKNESEESDSLTTTISKISSEVRYSDKYLIQSSNKLVSYV